jgi:hypothetical protein
MRLRMRLWIFLRAGLRIFLRVACPVTADAGRSRTGLDLPARGAPGDR